MIHQATQVPQLEPQTYTIFDRFAPEGSLSVFGGIEGTGKSTVMVLAASIVAQTSGVILSNEEDAQPQTKARLQAVGANLDNVYLPSRPYSFPRDTERLAEDVAEADAKLVIFDAVTQHIETSISHDQSLRRVLSPLAYLAETYDVALVFVAHTLRTASRAATITQTIQGPGLTRSARTIALFGRKPYGTRYERALCVVKDSYHELPKALTFQIDTEDVEGVPVAKMRVTSWQEDIDPFDLFEAPRPASKLPVMPVFTRRVNGKSKKAPWRQVGV